MGDLVTAEFADKTVARSGIREMLKHLMEQGLASDDYNAVIARQLVPEELVQKWAAQGVQIQSGYLASKDRSSTLLVHLAIPTSEALGRHLRIKIHCERVGVGLTEPTIHANGGVAVGADVPSTIGDLRKLIERVAKEMVKTQ